MSIKNKITVIMSLSVCAILGLNMILSFYTSQANLRKDSKAKLMLAAEQIAIAIEQSRYSSEYVESQIGQKLRMAAIMAAEKLDSDINHVQTQELINLTKQTGVSGFSLMIQTDNDIVVKKSSDPREIGLSTNNLGYWYNALKQLFEHQSVKNISEGQSLRHFWSGPFDVSTSNPGNIDKWGYYQDGKRNYLINPFIRSTDIEDFHQVMSPDTILQKTMDTNSSIKEITGINPKEFLIYPHPSRTKIYGYEADARNRQEPLLFGTYQYPSDRAVELVKSALKQDQSLLSDMKLHGKRYIESYIPIKKDGKEPYVIRMVSSYDPISSVIKKQLLSQLVVSLLLLAVVVYGCYLLAGWMTRPIHGILSKVNEMAGGHFAARLNINRRDEMGVLAERINFMASNLGQSTEELRQMNEENRSMREHLESVINQTADAIQLTDLEGCTIRVNRAFEQLYGWSEEELNGKRLDFIPASLKEEWTRHEDELRGGQSLLSIETVRLCKDGREIEVGLSQSPIFDKEGHITSFISVYRDMTERNKMEELLRRSEKLTTVGQLAAGVAHEIRNPLTTLRGFLQLQQSSGKVSSQHTDLMLSELDRINLIVSEFLILAKPQAVRFQVKDIRYIMGDVVSLLDSMAHLYNIQFLIDFSSDPIYVHCEENQLKQVFINLLKNAIEAMPEGGMISLEIKAEEDRVFVWIVDEGEGISEDKIPKLGEPFFTSKEHGTGLGLMVSQRIIEVHKGTMVIESAVGWGTLVTISLPIVSKEDSA